MSSCGKCSKDLSTEDVVVLSNTTVALCRECERSWTTSPESRRLRAISESLVAEWAEREGREATTREDMQRTADAEKEKK